MNPTTRLLVLEHIHQVYGNGERGFAALEDVNLSLSEGEFVTLLGPSGCGKSTLLRIITGLQSPSKGRVLYRGAVSQGSESPCIHCFSDICLVSVADGPGKCRSSP